jgi:hypothetical protein
MEGKLIHVQQDENIQGKFIAIPVVIGYIMFIGVAAITDIIQTIKTEKK